MTTQPKSRLEKLRSMKEQGLADPAELAELATLEASAPASNGTTPSDDSTWETIEGVNADKFGQGWAQGFIPPTADGIFKGIWTGVARSKNDADAVTLLF